MLMKLFIVTQMKMQCICDCHVLKYVCFIKRIYI